jgi:hypothetical protein
LLQSTVVCRDLDSVEPAPMQGGSMTDTTWDEVGHQFAELGRELQRAWQKGRVDDQTKRQLKDSGDKVKAALDDLAAKINRTADAGSHEERHDRTGRCARIDLA